MTGAAQSPNVNPQYFAQITDPAQYVEACLGKIRTFREWCQARGLENLWQTKLSNYYGLSQDGYSSQKALSGGSEGELTNIKVNDLRKLVQDQLVVITAQRPTGQARAINSDVRSLKNARLGTAIAEYYLSQAGFEQKFVDACEIALVLDEAFVDLGWNKDAGDPIRPDIDPATGQPNAQARPIMSGDLQLRTHVTYNTARDPDVKADNHKWHIFSILSNRYDLAAQYPDFKDQILKAAQDEVPQLKLQVRRGEDNVYMHLVLHDRTPAVPQGRMSVIIGSSLVADMEMPYPEYPVDRLTPADVIDGSVGYCASNDVMAMEQITDALHSIVTTNNVTFGGQSLAGPSLTGVVVTEIAKGLRYFEMQPDQVDKLIPLQLTKSAPETYAYIDKLSAKKQESLGSVSGTLQAQATQGASGSAMALIQAQAVQYNSGTQRSYYRLLSRSMTKGIGVLRVYADTPRVARIVGKSKSQGLKEFKYTGKDLNSISSIVYDMVNPVSQTIGGRMQIAQDLIANGMITSPRQYLTVIETGSLDALTNPDEDINLLILEENEQLSEGIPIQAVVTENHADHIKSHMSVIASPEAKNDPKLLENALGHIQQHLSIWQDASINNPAILLATGQQPLPVPQPMGPPPPGGPGGPPPGPSGQSPKLQGPPGQGLEAAQPQPPNMPTNPATGERATVPGVPA